MKCRFKLTVNRMLGIGTALFLLWYGLPLLDFKNNLAGVAADPLAHAAQIPAMCKTFFTGSWVNRDLFYPNEINMSNSYDMPLPGLLMCIFSPLGAVAMYNLLALINLVLIAGIGYLVSRKFIHNLYLRWAIVWLYTFSSFFISRAQVHQNIVTTLWTTPLVFALFAQLELEKRKAVSIAFVALAIAFLSAWQNIANLTFLVIFLILPRLIQAKNKKAAFGNLVIGVLIGTGICFPMVWPAFSNRSQAAFDFKYTPKTHADLLSYGLPIQQQWWSFITPDWSADFDFEQQVGINPLVWGLVLWAVIGSIKQKKLFKPLWLILIGIYIGLSFGGKITFNQQPILDLPYYQKLVQSPPLIFTRTPARFGVVVLFLVTLYGLSYWDKKFKRSGVWILGLALVLVVPGVVNNRYPTFNYGRAIPKIALNKIKQDPKLGAVFSVPVALEIDPMPNFLQYFHQKPMTHGYASYRVMVPDTLKLFDQQPELKRFACLTTTITNPFANYDIEDLTRINEIFTRVPVRYLIINRYLLSKPECGYVAKLMEDWFRAAPNADIIETNDTFVVIKL